MAAEPAVTPLTTAAVPLTAACAPMPEPLEAMFWLLPYTLVRRLPVAATMVWLALAPTWNCCVPKLPSSSLEPLNSVVCEMRSSSDTSWPTFCCRAWRSPALLEALADCTASSRTRCRMSPEAFSAPSAVCAREIPSFALRTAWFSPRIWLVKRSEIAKPAASSLALLMRRPDERRWMDVFSEVWLMPRLRWAVSELMLVLMVEAIANLLKELTEYGVAASRGRQHRAGLLGSQCCRPSGERRAAYGPLQLFSGCRRKT